jgi:hypothetical protein
MPRISLGIIAALTVVSASIAESQAPPAQVAAGKPLSAEEQIAAAVLAAPKEMRQTATVWGYTSEGKFTRLRQGQGPMICLASDPQGPKFHVSCYHRSLEPFMARGRALRAQGITGDRVDSLRLSEARAGKLRLPRHPAMLYSLTGPPDSFDEATGTAPKAQPLFVVYIPYATAASVGLTAAPVTGAPWIMDPGTPKAHIMFIPSK